MSAIKSNAKLKNKMTKEIQEREQWLAEALTENGIDPKSIDIKDFGIDGTETQSKIYEYAMDFVSDIHSEEMANKGWNEFAEEEEAFNREING